MEISIIDALPSDAPLIAEGVMAAVGDEICKEFAGENKTLADVKHLFTELAMREDSQYSWQNTRIAIDSDGNKLGICVAYPGSKLYELRKQFIDKANDILDKNIKEVDLPDETDGEEFYLDSLMVLPGYRGMGIGKKLIKDAYKRATLQGLPLGLLVEPENRSARRLYDSLGMKEVGMRPFAGTMMHHLILT